jgi:hypothetical protein
MDKITWISHWPEPGEGAYILDLVHHGAHSCSPLSSLGFGRCIRYDQRVIPVLKHRSCNPLPTSFPATSGKGHKEAASGKSGLPHNQNTYHAPRYLQERIVMYLLVPGVPEGFPQGQKNPDTLSGQYVSTYYRIEIHWPLLSPEAFGFSIGCSLAFPEGTPENSPRLSWIENLFALQCQQVRKLKETSQQGIKS